LYEATVAPLHPYDDSNDGIAVLEEALRDGFEVYYALHPNCTRCNPSNGNDENVDSCNYYCPDEDCFAPPKSGGMSSVPLISYTLLPKILILATHFPSTLFNLLLSFNQHSQVSYYDIIFRSSYLVCF